jgi:hypothetical protein
MLQALTEDAINSVTRVMDGLLSEYYGKKINTVLGYRQDFLEI